MRAPLSMLAAKGPACLFGSSGAKQGFAKPLIHQTVLLSQTLFQTIADSELPKTVTLPTRENDHKPSIAKPEIIAGNTGNTNPGNIVLMGGRAFFR